MHGAGNDYIYVNTLKNFIANPKEAAIAWSAPHTGIGGDGLVLIGTSHIADFSMHIFNADGSEAMMCGNASRCIGKYLYEYGLTQKTEITLETLSGIKILKLHTEGDIVSAVTVDMGTPADIKEIDFPEYGCKGTFVSMGNPHVVIFVNDVHNIDLQVIGPKIENHSLFPDRTNVEFAQIQPDKQIRMRVWERGSGITQACGTGACATAVAATLNDQAGKKNKIIMDGGIVSIEWDEQTKHILMTGPAVKVFDGNIELQQ